MDYFSAVQEGRRRVDRAVAFLQEFAGPCYPMLFLKMGTTSWTPVGDETLQKTVPGKGGTAALALCDSEGNAKAMSAWLPEARADEISKSLALKGVLVYPGEVRLPI